ncbi:MAG: response regulator transcription factor [Pseudomonadota bacterium]
MRLLVLEDDEKLGPWLQRGLREAGHVVDLFIDGKDALVAAMGQSYDVLILDRMVQGLDGLSVLKALRQAKVHVPTLFLTALGDIDDRVEALQAGGDDYLVKPYAFRELEARIEVLARRLAEPETASSVLSVADVTIDLYTRKCTRKGQKIDLNTKEFQLLEVFMKSKGRVQTRTMLLEQVWDMDFDPTTSVVETHISRLRSKIEKPFGDTLIRNIRGTGYVFGGD